MRATIDLAAEILAETEFKPLKPKTGAETQPKKPQAGKINRSIEIIEKAAELSEKQALAISGGSDSLVLTDLITKTGLKPVCVWADTGMDYPGTREYIQETVKRYGLDLRTARAQISPLELWHRTGWPMLGKMPARLWNQNYAIARGFRLNASECCRTLKIYPARELTRNIGAGLQFTGQRGKQDDYIRGFRTKKDGPIVYQEQNKIYIANPLTGWTDAEIKGYIQANRLVEHPARKLGAVTIGCIFCGGGSQFTNSNYPVLRRNLPNEWHRFIVQYQAGLIILAIKYRTRLQDIYNAIKQLGGLEYLAQYKPYIFDFTRKTPINGYVK